MSTISDFKTRGGDEVNGLSSKYLDSIVRLGYLINVETEVVPLFCSKEIMVKFTILNYINYNHN